MKTIMMVCSPLMIGTTSTLTILVIMAHTMTTMMKNFNQYFSNTTMMDQTASMMMMITVLVSLMSIMSTELNTFKKKSNMMMKTTIIMMMMTCSLTFSSANFFSFYFFLEATFLIMFSSLVMLSNTKTRATAAFYMLFYTLTVSMPFMILLMNNSKTETQMMTWELTKSYWWVMIYLIFMVKLPVYGVHLWLPKAHVEAPLSGSMMLAGILLKIGIYGISRFMMTGSMIMAKWLPMMYTIPLIGAMVTPMICMRQTDLKSMVAYSSVCHMSFAVCGLIMPNDSSCTGTMIMAFSHGIISPMMFFLVYTSYHRTNSRSILTTKGMSQASPTLSMVWFMISAMNMGTPPMMSFFPEILINPSIMKTYFMALPMTITMLTLSSMYNIYFFSSPNHGKFKPTNTIPMTTTEMCTTIPFVMMISSYILFTENLFK